MKRSMLKDIASSMKMAWSISKFGIIAPIVISVLSAARFFIPVYISAFVLLFIAGIIVLTVVPPLYYGKVTSKNYFKLIEEINSRKCPYSLLAYGKLLSYKDGKDIRIYRGEKLINDSIEKEEHCFQKDWEKRISISESKGGAVTALGNAGVMILAYVFVLLQATHGAVSVGNVVKYASMLVLFSDNMVGFFDCLTGFLNTAKQQAERDEFMTVPEEMRNGTAVPNRSVNAEFEFENVWFRYPGCDYDEDKINRCLAQSGFNTRLETLGDGLDTCLYKDFVDDGIEVSGGEAQKLAIARTIYKDAPVIVLDEPTAALDPIAEYEIYSKFDELAQGKTTLYISHRLSSCRFCDRIAVFDGGEIIECGTHERLLNENGKYAELWNAQAQYYN